MHSGVNYNSETKEYAARALHMPVYRGRSKADAWKAVANALHAELDSCRKAVDLYKKTGNRSFLPATDRQD